MRNKNEKGFALVLSLVLMLAMSLMGGALIVITASDHKSNNISDEFQQTFYVAETALLEGEKYVLDQFLGPWSTSTNSRDTTKRNFSEIDTLTIFAQTTVSTLSSMLCLDESLIRELNPSFKEDVIPINANLFLPKESVNDFLFNEVSSYIFINGVKKKEILINIEKN